MPDIRDLMRADPVVVSSDTSLVSCALHLVRHPEWRMLIARDGDAGTVEGVVDDIAVFGNGVMLKDGLWFAFEPEGPDVAGTVAIEVPMVEGSEPAGTALRELGGRSAIIVLDEGEVVGLVTEHDVLSIAPSILREEQRVDETASRPVISVSSSTTAQQALQRMGDARIRHLVVVDDGELTGVVSLRDVVAGWVGPETPLERLLTKDPFTLLLGTSLRTAAGQMAERDVGCMPVLDGEGELVAILTRADIVSALAAASDDEDLFA